MTAAQNITQLLTGFPKWQTTTITYSFITEYAPYTPLNYQEPGGPTLLSAAQIAATKQLFARWRFDLAEPAWEDGHKALLNNGVFGSIQQASDFII